MSDAFIKLDSNENPFGASPSAKLAAEKALADTHRYHDSDYLLFKNALAPFLSVGANQLTIGNGSENILEMIIKACCKAHDSAIISQYTFITIPFLLDLHHITTTVVPTLSFKQDLNGMLAALNSSSRIIFLVNPENPIGHYINTAELVSFLQQVPSHVLVVIDEAYYEYIDKSDFPNTISLLNTFSNLIIVRTFSKAYGLAGLRVGYAISSKEIAQQLNAVRLPYYVNSIAIHAAVAALHDQHHITYSTNMNKQGYKQLSTGLEALQLSYLPSVGNFISVNVGNAEEISHQLRQQQIFVKPLNAYQLPNYIRVTIGTEAQIQAFLTAIAKVLVL